MLTGLVSLLIFSVVVSQELNVSWTKCSYQSVVNYLNFTKNKELFSMTRPVKDHRKYTVVNLELMLYAVLDVQETEQKFLSNVWIDMNWENEFISWDPKDFCDINRLVLPADVLWKPDVIIAEATDMEKAPQSPHVILNSDGTVKLKTNQLLITACKMKTYKFPFDVQMCNLTFKSVVYNKIKLNTFADDETLTQYSEETMKTEYEWLLVNITAKNENDDNEAVNSIIFTITLRRKPILFLVNFLLPVLFFLGLDLASFLISDRDGSKLGFKVTVLLAITVMQLILHEFLPSSSNRLPLIAVYYTGIFVLMMLSLLEAIVVAYLLEKESSSPLEHTDSEVLSEDCETDLDSCERQGKTMTEEASISDGSTDQLSKKLNQGCGSRPSVGPDGQERHVDEVMKDVVKTLTLLLKSQKEVSKPGYWTKMTEKINKVFFVFYIIAASLFLLLMCFLWNHE